MVKKLSKPPHNISACAARLDALESRLTTLEQRLESMSRTDDDKRRDVERALCDPKLVQLSDREIARQCSVSHGFVNKMRKDLELHDPNAPRLVTRGGTTYPMRIGGITTRKKR